MLVGIAFHRPLSGLRRTFLIFDALGIAFFTILGVEKALTMQVKPEIAAIMGMFTAVMGGVIRDTLANDIPVLLRKEIYATACLAGAIIYLILTLHFAWPRSVNLMVSTSVIIIIRLVAVQYGLSLPGMNGRT